VKAQIIRAITASVFQNNFRTSGVAREKERRVKHLAVSRQPTALCPAVQRQSLWRNAPQRLPALQNLHQRVLLLRQLPGTGSW
jgi:hypothetical protein